MAKLNCEVCGGEITRNADGVFICDRCGCKYSLDAVRRMYGNAGGTPSNPAAPAVRDFEIVGGQLMKYNGTAEDVVVPDGVKTIADRVFQSMKGITSVTLPEGLLEIGSEAFRHCTRLKKVNIPSTVEKIGYKAFYDCSVESIDIPSSVTHIGSHAFEGCTSLTSVKMNARIKEVGLRTFGGCTSLKEIKLLGTVEEIGDSAFEGCTSLKEIKLPETVEKIGDSAFRCCSALKTVTLSKNIRLIEVRTAFEGCDVKFLCPDGVDKLEYSDSYHYGNQQVIYSDRYLERQKYMQSNRCRHCGGEFRGMFTKTCSKCGRVKDY